MVQITDALLFAVLATSRAVYGAPAPLAKRIAQTTIDAVTKWEDACNTAGGAQQCNTIAVNAAATLLAAAGPCDQQDSADTMIDLAKTLNNDANMISLAQIFTQQPRNSPTSQSVPYCQSAPKNTELNGLFQCQFQGSDPKTFVGGIAVGQAGTIPFGLTSPLDPAGSCPANPSGPIADGTQLNAITTNPGVAGSTGSSSSGSSSASSSSASSGVNNSGSGSAAGSGSDSAGSSAAAVATTSSAPAAVATSSSSSSSSSGFQLQNGEDAQALNKKFASLTASSSCTDGEQACIGSAFAQCVSGSFVTTACAGGTTCAALPLVNKAGTSITCTTTSDAEARIAATGATGGLTGDGSSTSGSASTASSDSAPATAASSAPATNNAAAGSSASSSSFLLSNGQDAQKLNAQFASLSASSSCTEGENACVNGGFAQCSGGKFVITQCAGGTTCAALPLVNKAGTSIACTTTADAEARIAATGAQGGLTGSS